MAKLHIFLNTEEYTENDRDINITLEEVSAYATKHKTFDFEIDANIGDPIIVLIEHYSDGNTFGTNEYMEVKGVFKTLGKAEKFSKTINTNHGYFGKHLDFLFETAIIRDRK